MPRLLAVLVGVVSNLLIVEQVLAHHSLEVGHDFVAYRNHVYRVINFCLAIVGDDRDLEKITVAAVFHDLGIWTDNTFDYIAPSAALAREYLATRDLTDWSAEIEAMIVDHHKITPSCPRILVEAFRRADWIDVTLGLRSFGLPRTLVKSVFANWPNAGFHRRLVALTIGRGLRHPLSPLPMVKW